MGYGTRNNGQIKTFWPDDTDTKIYIQSESEISLGDLWEKAEAKWPGISVFEIKITSEQIQTDCLSYNRYDPMDYTDFIIIRRVAGA